MGGAAAFGEGLISVVTERAEPLNLEDGSAHPRYRRIVETGEERPITVSWACRSFSTKRCWACWWCASARRRKFAENEVTFMVTLAAQLAGAIIHAEASGGFTRLIRDDGGAAFTLKGLSGAPGVAIGQALVVYPPANLEAIPDRKVSDPDAEEASFRAAIVDVQREVRAMSRQMADTLPPEELVLFDALALMVGSEDLVEGVVSRIHAGNWAPGALRDTIQELLRAFEEMEDPYLRERATDIRDLGRRILMRLQAQSPMQKFSGDGRVILVGTDIAASHLAEVPAAQLAGVVSARGSSSSHVAILARALGIPAVMGVADLPVGRLESQQLVVDGYRGRIYVRPTPGAVVGIPTPGARGRTARAQRLAGIGESARRDARWCAHAAVCEYRADGGHLALGAQGAEGVGLYRTEVPFLVRDRFPGEDEQMQIYRQVLEGFSAAAGDHAHAGYRRRQGAAVFPRAGGQSVSGLARHSHHARSSGNIF